MESPNRCTDNSVLGCHFREWTLCFSHCSFKCFSVLNNLSPSHVRTGFRAGGGGRCCNGHRGSKSWSLGGSTVRMAQHYWSPQLPHPWAPVTPAQRVPRVCLQAHRNPIPSQRSPEGLWGCTVEQDPALLSPTLQRCPQLTASWHSSQNVPHAPNTPSFPNTT